MRGNTGSGTVSSSQIKVIVGFVQLIKGCVSSVWDGRFASAGCNV